jgi:hypothetical protein
MLSPWNVTTVFNIFFGPGEPLCLHSLYCSFVSGSYKCILFHSLSKVEPRVRQCSYLWTHNTITLLIRIHTFWYQFSRELLHVQIIMNDEPYTFPIYLQSLCYILVGIFRSARTMLWTVSYCQTQIAQVVFLDGLNIHRWNIVSQVEQFGF